MRTKYQGDKISRLLQPLLILGRLQQYITIDFRLFLKDRYRYDTIYVFVNRLTKRPISILYYKEIDAKGIARIFINYIFCQVGLLDSVILDYRPQFIVDFQKEFYRILGIQRRLSTIYYTQIDSQIEITNQYIAQRLRPYISYY